ncbi:hypothetical protein LWI29_007811 [Acer saccharum]|uniref:Uncharacterized protein n=1 Tax=Acer saccharum TaxID=4024 RepID=A0AA39SAD7_ACESA|nr:hypothetical protein LWI29_007811 [Acer saccharum]
MSCIQAGGLCSNLPNRPLRKHITSTPFRTSLKLNATTYKLLSPHLKCQIQRSPVCLLGGGEDKPQNEGAPWKAFGKAMENFNKGQAIEDVLRQQMEKKEYFDGSGGKSPPSDGGGGGGDGSGESGDEGLSGVMDETVQVVLATIGFIFLYIYILTGEELIRLAKDYIKYLFKGSKSVRLTSAMNTWDKFWKKLNEKKVYDNMGLEKAIINTPTWYDSPEKYRRILRSYAAASRSRVSESDESDDE